MYPLKREVSFVNSLPLDVIAIVVGWIYTISWIMCYYPQVLNDIMGIKSTAFNMLLLLCLLLSAEIL